MGTFDAFGTNAVADEVLVDMWHGGHMVASRVRLTGVDEGIACTVTTVLRGADDGTRVVDALAHFFPEVTAPDDLAPPSFGVNQDRTLEWTELSMNAFLDALHQQRILDTALDAMSRFLHDETTHFHIGRQAAAAGKVSFPIPDEQPVGGTFDVRLTGRGLGDWLEAATWHPGRSQVPRAIGDERSMTQDGEASTWH